MTDANETAALIIEHTIKKGEEQRYEEWTNRILETVSRFPGYLGREVFPSSSAGKPYTIIVRFRNQADLRAWLESPERKSFVEQMQDAFETGDKTEIKAGIDVWFTPETAPNKPPAYKQFLLTAAAIYPLTLIIPRLYSPLFQAVPPLAHPLVTGLIIASTITALMTWLIMPNLTRWLHGWLFASKAKKGARIGRKV